MPAPTHIKKPNPTPFLVRSLVPLVTIAGACLLASAGVFTLDGHLGVVWPAFLLVMLGPLLFPFILFPAGLMAGLWNAFHGKGKAIVRVFAVASVGYLALVMSATLAVMAALATNLPVDSMRFFAEMFVVAGAVTPWAVFALRDRNNQLFILLVWSLAIVGALLLPLKMMGVFGPIGYGAAAWCGIMLVMLAEHLRQTQAHAASERAKVAAAPAQSVVPSDEPPAAQ